jgi:hypothetical protein
MRVLLSLSFLLLPAAFAPQAQAEGEWEITPQSEQALRAGLQWLKENQGAEGNWDSNDLGLVSMGALAFMSAGHSPGVGPYGRTLDRSLDYVMKSAKPSGLLNISHQQRDMYNHGLATFVLGQAHGMTGDRRINQSLDKALKLIAATQCGDGGWDYKASRQSNGHDLSLVVMQAKALRSAVDSGLEVPPEVIDMAIKSVRQHYCPRDGRRSVSEAEQMRQPGQFTYGKGGGGGTVAMAAAGVVCLQEFGQYDDWRIQKNMEVIRAQIKQLRTPSGRNGQMPFDAYTLYYVGQALYQVGGDYWTECYPILRDYLVTTQMRSSSLRDNGKWQSGGHVGGQPGELYGTAVGCFILAIPNRYLPILQEGKIESLRRRGPLE